MRTLHRHQYELRASILSNLANQIHGGVAPARLSAEEQVEIYRNHYRFTLIDALKATFPVVEKLVGETFFAVMAWRFIGRHPPEGPVLFEYGRGLSAFIDECERVSSDLPYLADVARLEWALNAAYHADDADPMTLADLGAMPPDRVGRAVLTFHPSVDFVRSPYPVDAIWNANQPGADPNTVVRLDQGEARLVVYRRELDVEWRALSVAEDGFLTALVAGADLESADGTARALGDFELAPTLAWSFAAGLFTGIADPITTILSRQRSSVR